MCNQPSDRFFYRMGNIFPARIFPNLQYCKEAGYKSSPTCEKVQDEPSLREESSPTCKKVKLQENHRMSGSTPKGGTPAGAGKPVEYIETKGPEMNEEIKKLIEILTDINEDVDFANEKALVDDGLIDSFDITSIITALDEEYGVRIEASEIEPENFNSVEAILETVKRYQKKK